MKKEQVQEEEENKTMLWPRKLDAEAPATGLELVVQGGCTQEEQERGTERWRRERVGGFGLIRFVFKLFRIMDTEMNTSTGLTQQ